MWLRGLVFAALCLLPVNSFGAIAYDNSGTATGAGVTSLSFSLTVTGTNLVVVGSSAIYQAPSLATLSGMTYNAVALTSLGSATTGSKISDQQYLKAPATGANTFQCNYTNTSSYDLGCGAISLTGVDQTTPVGTTVTANGSSTTPSVTVTSAAGEMVVDALMIEHTAVLTVGAGQTQQYQFIGANGFIKHAASTEPGAASVPMTWTNGTSTTWAQVATPFKPVATASVVPRLPLLGVGP